MLLVLLVTHTLSRMATSTATGFLVSKRTAEVGTYNIYNIYTILYALQVDGWVLLAGLAVLLQQHPPYLTTQLLQRLDQAENSFTLAGDSADLGLVTTFRQHLAQAIRLDDLP